MPSSFDQTLADDFDRCFDEFKETVIRRIGGQADRAEPVEAITEFDIAGGGFTSNQQGERTDILGRLEVAADQEVTENDAWVIQDGPYAGVYLQRGVPTSGDGGSKTVELTKRMGRLAAQPKVRTQ